MQNSVISTVTKRGLGETLSVHHWVEQRDQLVIFVI
jgi:hypothetical protein